jgi:putative membrane protein
MWCGEHVFGLGWGGWLLAVSTTLLFWGGVIALVFFAVSAFTSRDRQSAGPAATGDTALEILKKRYARDEISQSEYQEIRQQLET